MGMTIMYTELNKRNMKLTAQTNRTQKGFTLIELLVVIGILAILLAITLIAINPAKQFASANDTKRSSDVNAILNAIGQYQANNHGQLPSGITTTPTDVGNSTGLVDLCSALVTSYIAALPMDPTHGTPSGAGQFDCKAVSGTVPTYDTYYQVSKGAADNPVTVSAPGVEGSNPITVTR